MDEHQGIERRYVGKERREHWSLTEEEIEIVVKRVADIAATRAADLVFERFYGEVGKGVLKRFTGLVVLCFAAAMAYLTGKGYWK
jgi:small neutral amino acid transporter SnatA (MarC family)